MSQFATLVSLKSLHKSRSSGTKKQYKIRQNEMPCGKDMPPIQILHPRWKKPRQSSEKIARGSTSSGSRSVPANIQSQHISTLQQALRRPAVERTQDPKVDSLDERLTSSRCSSTVFHTMNLERAMMVQKQQYRRMQPQETRQMALLPSTFQHPSCLDTHGRDTFIIMRQDGENGKGYCATKLDNCELSST